MSISITKVPLRRILAYRDRYRAEMNCQIVHDSWHERGFTTAYAISAGGHPVGYGCVGGVGSDPKDVVKEFYVDPDHRPRAEAMFDELVRVSGARSVEAQTNDRLLTQMLLLSADTIERDRVLFEDGIRTHHALPGSTFRRIGRLERRRVFAHEVEPVGDWVIEMEGTVVATGGLMFHYNPPFSDLYMEVAPEWRCRGVGTYLVQELKRVSHEMGKVPAARTNAENTASRRTLQKAGMIPCAWILQGALREISTPEVGE